MGGVLRELRAIRDGQFKKSLHFVGLRPKDPLPLFICGPQITGAADASLWRNSVRELLDDHIRRIELGYVFKGAH